MTSDLDRQVISYDSTRGGVSVVTIRGVVTASYLLIQRARPSDSGRYSCQPSGASQQSLRVHVLQGQTPAVFYLTQKEARVPRASVQRRPPCSGLERKAVPDDLGCVRKRFYMKQHH